jgi:hypothetical protein
MAMNRFSRPGKVAAYQPMSFQELAFAPIQMRQREDRLLDAKDQIQSELNNFKGMDQYNEETSEYINQLQQRADSLAEKIQKEGAGNFAYSSELRGLRNDYGKFMSETGVGGMSSALKNNIDQQKTAFWKVGNEKGWPQERIEANWQKELQKIGQQLPKNLKDHKGSLPQIQVGLPPNKVDMELKAAKAAQIIGYVTQNYGELKEVNGEVLDSRGQVVTNKPGVAAWMDLMQNEIYNPNSDLRRHIDFEGSDPKEYENKLKNLAVMLLKEKGGSTGSKTTTTKGNGKDNKPAKDVIHLAELSASGDEAIENSSTAFELSKEIIAIERGEAGDMTEEERNFKKDQYIQALQDVKQIETDEEFGFEKQMNAALQDPTREEFAHLRKAGLDTWEKIQEVKDEALANNPNVNADDITMWDFLGFNGKSFFTAMTESMSESDARNINNIMEQVKPVYKEIIGTGLQKVSSQQYSFGHGDADEKVTEYLSKGINPDRFQNMIALKAIKISEGPMKPFVDAGGYLDGDNGKKLLDITEKLQRGKAKIRFGTINTGGVGQSPTLKYTISPDSGNSMTFTVDLLRDKEFAKEILNPKEPLYQNMAPKGKLILDVIRDNINYAGVAVSMDDSTKIHPGYNNKQFDPVATENIKKYSSIANQELFGREVKNTESPVGIDKVMYDNLFFKPSGEEGYQYAITIGPDGSYSSHKKDEESGKIIDYTFKDFFDKEFAAEWVTNVSEYDDSEDTKVRYQNAKLEFTKNKLAGLLHNTGNISNYDETLPYYNKSATFKNALQEVYDIRQFLVNNPDKTAEANERFKQVIKTIGPLTFQTKRKQYAL